MFLANRGPGKPAFLEHSLSLGDEKARTLSHNLSHLSDSGSKIADALLELNVRRLEYRLQNGEATDGIDLRTDAYVAHEDMATLRALAASTKRCAYQLCEEREMLCSGASADDETKVGRRGLRHLAPTTQSLCATCRMPAAGLLCSHLMRPAVVGISTDQAGIVARVLTSAMCAVGSSHITDPSRCRPDGHPCWERVVEEEDPYSQRAVGPLTLHHCLDHLALSWRAWRGRREPLFDHRSAEHLGGLAQDCESRAELGQRLNELDSVLKSFVIPADPPTPLGSSTGPLLHLSSFLTTKLQARGDNDPMDVDRLNRAIGTLRRISAARAALEHPGRAKVTPEEAFGELGLVYPIEDWRRAWEMIKLQSIDALLALSQVVDVLGTSETLSPPIR